MPGRNNTVLVVGGTGAQGAAVVKALSDDSPYEIRVLTRSAASPAAAELVALPGVTIMEGDPYEEATLQRAFDGVEFAWINTNGFAIGEKNEIYWGIRMYEIARSRGVAHFQWASLPYVSKLGNFDPKYRTGHMDGKGKVADYIIAQPTSPMRWTVLTSCMYMETLTELLAPRQSPDDPDLMVFAAPLGHGRPPLIYLADLGRYARWVFDNPDRSNGMNLMVATENVGWEYLAKTFTEVTGNKAVFKDITLDELFASGAFAFPDGKVGHSAIQTDPTLQTYRQNFSGFWNNWKADLVQVDYAVLDDILPTRVKTLGEWMKLVGYTGERRPVLKDYQDHAKRRQQGFEDMKVKH